jgi:hypothetical protein
MHNDKSGLFTAVAALVAVFAVLILNVAHPEVLRGGAAGRSDVAFRTAD